jgi:UPF0716 protein FxsA
MCTACPYVGAGGGEVYLRKGLWANWSDKMWVLLAILAVPFIEIALFVTLGGALGLWLTLAWVIVAAALGLLVVKGLAMTGSISLGRDIREMGDPLSPLAHRGLVGIAGLLLIIPGFFTDAIGLLLLIPPVRRLFIKLIGKKLGGGAIIVRSDVIDGEWRDVSPEAERRPDLPPTDPTRH